MRQIIRNALIVNGDGVTEPRAGDILIENDRIVALGSLQTSDEQGADREIDAAGRAVAPGFVDMHNHGALGGTRPGPSGLPLACELALRGGVTKRICGVDGLSPAPVLPEQRNDYAAQLRPLDGLVEGDWSWSSVAEFWAWHRGRSVTDMGLYLGHSAVRRVVMDNLARVASDAEIELMCEVVRREAPWTLGLSTGLIYNPAVYSDQREITALVRAFNQVQRGALFPHLRSESDLVIESLKEVVEASIDGGGAYCNEHSKIAGKRNYEKIAALESLLEDASASVPVIENMYPYPAGSTTGDAIFPPEVRAGSREEFLVRLEDPATRKSVYQRMRGDTRTWDNFIDFCGGLQGIQIAGVRAGVGDRFLGRRLSDVAKAAGAADLDSLAAYEAVFDFYLDNRGEVSIITHYGNDYTVERLFRRPTMAICTDGLMPGPGQKPHPRAIGAFPKALRMAREMGIAVKEIVYRMSTLPCRFLGLEDPVLRAGADASLVLFDWDRVRELNDYLNPLVAPQGIDSVWVHGERVLEEGALITPARYPGRILYSHRPPAA
jgi:N-acyl-D-amino-acid deacylase